MDFKIGIMQCNYRCDKHTTTLLDERALGNLHIWSAWTNIIYACAQIDIKVW